MSSSSSSKNLSVPLLITGLFGWVVIGFLIAQYVVVIASRALLDSIGYTYAIENSPLLQLVISAIAYVAALCIIVGLPKLLLDAKKISLKKEFGIDKKPKLSTLGYGVLGYGVYFILTILFSLIIQLIWKDFPIDQAQQVGFGNLATTPEYAMAFIALVIIPPIAEELLFRGYFYGKIRAVSRFWVSAVITSVLFGLVHWQWNVGVDVFALSLVLCALREYTGSVWAGIILHMTKNAIAFTLLFLQPNVLQLILKYLY